MQTVIRMDRPLANDHLEGLSPCILLSGETLLLKMIIQRDQPLANDHPDQPDSSSFSFYYSANFVKQTFRLLHQILGSTFNLADLSRTMCSCCLFLCNKRQGTDCCNDRRVRIKFHLFKLEALYCRAGF